MNKRIIHIITGLNTGGAEMMLYKLLHGMDKDKFQCQVISLTDIGPVGQRIQALGVPVRALGMRRGFPNPWAMLKLVSWLRHDSPHIVQTWMYHADLVGGMAARLAGGIPVVWNIRQSNLDAGNSKRTTIWTVRTCAKLSKSLPARIICCSEASKRVHIGLGYSANKMIVIPNGFNLLEFRPDPAQRLSVRQELGIPDDALLIGLVARFAPQKDHHNFIQAAAVLHVKFPDAHFLLCGDGVTWENPQLVGWIEKAGLRECCHLLGRRDDMARVTAAFDIASSSSYSEGFPNIVGEAMACGVPCVVTDVGDSALIVGDTGKVVPPRNPLALAEAWADLIEAGPDMRSRLGSAARRRIQENFSLPVVVGKYEALYEEIIASVRY
ncbi:MAG: glycosyltransferase [Syntrophomonadaceae bacterium]|nr:glycosyltransferase [Syntrophomonadaceae bacterium]